MEDAYDSVKEVSIWLCHRDKIAINKLDPLVGTWDNPKLEKVSCPNCNADMKVFFTSTGFFFAKCPKPKCRCEVRSNTVKEEKKP
jgi:hypothetical protein